MLLYFVINSFLLLFWLRLSEAKPRQVNPCLTEGDLKKQSQFISYCVLRDAYCEKEFEKTKPIQSQLQDAGSDSAMEFEEKCLQRMLKMQKT